MSYQNHFQHHRELIYAGDGQEDNSHSLDYTNSLSYKTNGQQNQPVDSCRTQLPSNLATAAVGVGVGLGTSVQHPPSTASLKPINMHLQQQQQQTRQYGNVAGTTTYSQRTLSVGDRSQLMQPQPQQVMLNNSHHGGGHHPTTQINQSGEKPSSGGAHGSSYQRAPAPATQQPQFDHTNAQGSIMPNQRQQQQQQQQQVYNNNSRTAPSTSNRLRLHLPPTLDVYQAPQHQQPHQQQQQHMQGTGSRSMMVSMHQQQQYSSSNSQTPHDNGWAAQQQQPMMATASYTAAATPPPSNAPDIQQLNNQIMLKAADSSTISTRNQQQQQQQQKQPQQQQQQPYSSQQPQRQQQQLYNSGGGQQQPQSISMGGSSQHQPPGGGVGRVGGYQPHQQPAATQHLAGGTHLNQAIMLVANSSGMMAPQQNSHGATAYDHPDQQHQHQHQQQLHHHQQLKARPASYSNAQGGHQHQQHHLVFQRHPEHQQFQQHPHHHPQQHQYTTTVQVPPPSLQQAQQLANASAKKRLVFPPPALHGSSGSPPKTTSNQEGGVWMAQAYPPSSSSQHHQNQQQYVHNNNQYLIQLQKAQPADEVHNNSRASTQPQHSKQARKGTKTTGHNNKSVNTSSCSYTNMQQQLSSTLPRAAKQQNGVQYDHHQAKQHMLLDGLLEELKREDEEKEKKEKQEANRSLGGGSNLSPLGVEEAAAFWGEKLPKDDDNSQRQRDGTTCQGLVASQDRHDNQYHQLSVQEQRKKKHSLSQSYNTTTTAAAGHHGQHPIVELPSHYPAAAANNYSNLKQQQSLLIQHQHQHHMPPPKRHFASQQQAHNEQASGGSQILLAPSSNNTLLAKQQQQQQQNQLANSQLIETPQRAHCFRIPQEGLGQLRDGNSSYTTDRKCVYNNNNNNSNINNMTSGGNNNHGAATDSKTFKANLHSKSLGHNQPGLNKKLDLNAINVSVLEQSIKEESALILGFDDSDCNDRDDNEVQQEIIVQESISKDLAGAQDGSGTKDENSAIVVGSGSQPPSASSFLEQGLDTASNVCLSRQQMHQDYQQQPHHHRYSRQHESTTRQAASFAALNNESVVPLELSKTSQQYTDSQKNDHRSSSSFLQLSGNQMMKNTLAAAAAGNSLSMNQLQHQQHQQMSQQRQAGFSNDSPHQHMLASHQPQQQQLSGNQPLTMYNNNGSSNNINPAASNSAQPTATLDYSYSIENTMTVKTTTQNNCNTTMVLRTQAANHLQTIVSAQGGVGPRLPRHGNQDKSDQEDIVFLTSSKTSLSATSSLLPPISAAMSADGKRKTQGKGEECDNQEEEELLQDQEDKRSQEDRHHGERNDHQQALIEVVSPSAPEEETKHVAQAAATTPTNSYCSKTKMVQIEPGQVYAELERKANINQDNEFQRMLLEQMQQRCESEQSGHIMAGYQQQLDHPIGRGKNKYGARSRSSSCCQDKDEYDDEDPMGCNLGTHISTKRSSNSKEKNKNAGKPMSPSLISTAMVTITKKRPGLRELLGSPNMDQKKALIKATHKQPSQQVDAQNSFINNQNSQLSQYDMQKKMEDHLISVDYQNGSGQQQHQQQSYDQNYRINDMIDAENLQEAFIDVSHNVDAVTIEGGTGEGSSCSNQTSSNSSLSIYQKYPNLPTQLREILELQNFRIQNMQAEVNTLKEQNAAHTKALAEQEGIKNQLLQLTESNNELQEKMDKQQRMHMIEMDQNCSQIATMMEALKLLTCDMTIDMEQTQILGTESMAKEGESELPQSSRQMLDGQQQQHQMPQQQQSHNITMINGRAAGQRSTNTKSQSELQGILSKSLLQLKRSPGLSSTYSLTNSKLHLRALQNDSMRHQQQQVNQTIRQDDERQQARLHKTYNTFEDHHQSIVVTSARKVIKTVVETTTVLENIAANNDFGSDGAENISSCDVAHTQGGNHLMKNDVSQKQSKNLKFEIHPGPVLQSTKFGGRAEAYMAQAFNKVLGSEEQTQQVDCFTDDGDLVLSDEANIPDSARASLPKISLTPVFQKKSKHQIDLGLQSATRDLTGGRAKSMSVVKQNSRLLLSGSGAQNSAQMMQSSMHQLPHTAQQQNSWQRRQEQDVVVKRQLVMPDDYFEDPTSNETGVTATNILCQEIKIREPRQQQQLRKAAIILSPGDLIPKSQLQNQIKQRGGVFFGQKVPMAGEPTKHLSLITAQQNAHVIPGLLSSSHKRTESTSQQQDTENFKTNPVRYSNTALNHLKINGNQASEKKSQKLRLSDLSKKGF